MMLYMCKYTPVELIKAFGVPVEMPNHETEDLSEADTLIHNNVCSHARQLLLEIRGAEEAVLTTCCDSVRRVGDVLTAGWSGAGGESPDGAAALIGPPCRRRRRPSSQRPHPWHPPAHRRPRGSRSTACAAGR